MTNWLSRGTGARAPGLENLLSYYNEGEFLSYPSWARLVHAVKRMEPKLLVSFTSPWYEVEVSK